MKRFTRMTFLLPWFICGLGALFYAYEYILRITPSVMTSELMLHYRIHNGSLGNLSAYYYYVYTPMQLAVGILMDKYGPRRLLTIATMCCVIGSVLFAATQYLFVAELGRFLVGFGSAFAFVGVLKLATIWLPRRYFAMFTGFATAVGMLGAVFGDVVLTMMVNSLGWRETSFLSALFGVFLALMIGLFVHDHKSFDRKSVPKNRVNFKEIFEGVKTIIKTKQMWVAGLIGMCLYIPTSVFAEMWGIPYLETVHHLGNETAAIANSMCFAGWAFGGPIYGWISDRIKRRKLPIVVSGIMSATIFSAILLTPNLPETALFILLFLFGAFSGGQIIAFAVGLELGPERVTASILAFINMMVMVGGLILQPLIGYMLDFIWGGSLLHGIQVFSTHDYQISLSVIIVVLLTGAFLAQFVLQETRCQYLKRRVYKLPINY